MFYQRLSREILFDHITAYNLGGRVVSDTYIRYTTGAYEFRIRQVLTGFEDAPEVETKAVKGKVTFSGRLPAIAEGVKVSYNDYSQVYMRTGPGEFIYTYIYINKEPVCLYFCAIVLCLVVQPQGHGSP